MPEHLSKVSFDQLELERAENEGMVNKESQVLVKSGKEEMLQGVDYQLILEETATSEGMPEPYSSVALKKTIQ